jgi:hypothetical protein
MTQGTTYVGLDSDLCHREDLLEAGRNSSTNSMFQLPISVNTTSRELMESGLGEPYSFLIGKWGATADKRRVHPMFLQNNKLWNYMTNQTNLVVLNCPDEFFEMSGATKNSKIVCLDTESKFRTELYMHLVKNAQLVLGIGSPPLSPSPIEALSCSRPIVLASGMHYFVHQYVSEPAHYEVDSEEQVIRAFEEILSPNGRITTKAIQDTTRDMLMDLLYQREGAVKDLMLEVETSCSRQIEIGFYTNRDEIAKLI